MSLSRVKKQQSGFSLIELAVVLVIVGILLGSILGTIGARIDNTRRAETQDALDDIRLSLYGYALSQSPVRLPCPDTDNDGLEDLTGASCSTLTSTGNLPWRTLGIARGDAWSSNYSYWVADEYSNTAGFSLATNGTGVAEIRNSTAAPPPVNVISDNVAAVIFSHGKNSFGSVDVYNEPRPAIPAGAAYNDERENLDNDAAPPVVFISRPVASEGAATAYDDILTWISEYELKGMMVQAGALPP